VSVIPFGSMVRDRITGFEGFTVFRVEHMNGCLRYGVQPVINKEGQLPEAKVLDGPDIEIIASPKDDLPPVIKTVNAFKLGVKVKDRLTGFTGIVVLRLKHMYSGDRYGIQSPVNDKLEIPEIRTFDDGDLEQVDPPPRKKKEKKEKKPPEGPHGHNIAIAR